MRPFFSPSSLSCIIAGKWGERRPPAIVEDRETLLPDSIRARHKSRGLDEVATKQLQLAMLTDVVTRTTLAGTVLPFLFLLC